MRRPLALSVSLVVLAGCGGSKSPSASSVAVSPDPPTAPTLTTNPPPWPAPTSGVSALVAEAHLPLLPSEGLVEHIHAHLDVFYDGQRVTVPPFIGIDPSHGISPLHTHDATGIVHVESPVVAPFHLGQFFTEWGVKMADGCVAGQCPPARPIQVYVNGVGVQVPPDQVEVSAHAEIVLVIGSAPASIPASFSFPSGY